jgi:hypothetical protein
MVCISHSPVSNVDVPVVSIRAPNDRRAVDGEVGVPGGAGEHQKYGRGFCRFKRGEDERILNGK